MRDIVDDEQQSDRPKPPLPKGLRRRPVKGFVAAPGRCPASPTSPLLALAGRRSQRGPRDFRHGLPGRRQTRKRSRAAYNSSAWTGLATKACIPYSRQR
jgi:hypothetical protein